MLGNEMALELANGWQTRLGVVLDVISSFDLWLLHPDAKVLDR